MEKGLIVTIDGPAGAGKSTAARLLAKKLGCRYLDSGATYRVVALLAQRRGIDPQDDEALARLCEEVDIEFREGGQRVMVGGEDLTEEIRRPEVGMGASLLSQRKVVREAMARLQRRLARGGAVAEGRDMGTVVFPEAQVKFYLDATLKERARRRYRELKERGMEADFASVLEEIRQRDHQDSTRELSPLRQAPDAVRIDSTHLSPEEVVQRMLEVIRERGWR